MEETEFIMDAAQWAEKREAMRILSDAGRQVSALTHGQYRIVVNIMRHRKRRSDRQCRYYWPCFIKPLGDYLRAQGDTTDAGDLVTDQHVHDMFRAKFLRTAMVDKATGKVLGSRIRSTTELSTAEFNEYLEHVAAWLAQFVGIVVPEPSVWREKEAA